MNQYVELQRKKWYELHTSENSFQNYLGTVYLLFYPNILNPKPCACGRINILSTQII
jgi:hypothetical protein